MPLGMTVAWSGWRDVDEKLAPMKSRMTDGMRGDIEERPCKYHTPDVKC